MYKTSLVTRTSIDQDQFPLMTIRSCISEADESRNGPRFCAQDKLTGCAYEVRCVKLDISPAEAGVSLSKKNIKKLRQQQERIDALMAASSSDTVPHSVVFPIDVYIQEQPSTGRTFVESVDPFYGLSLGDIVRSGWCVVEERAFFDILEAVEAYGCASPSLPPHGNLSADCIRQLLTVRDGAAEAECLSRWVVGDWLLTYDKGVDTFEPHTFVGDIEWMLHSSFQEVNVATDTDGSFLSRGFVDKHINETVEFIRDNLNSLSTCQCKSSISVETARKLSISVGTGNSLLYVPYEETSATSMQPPHSHGAAEVGNSFPTSASGIGDDTQQMQNNLADVVPMTMSLKDRLSYHQNALRKEQQLATKYRRRNAPLPPLPQTPSVTRPEYPEEDLEYELHYLTSPLTPQISQLLSNCSIVGSNHQHGGDTEKAETEREVLLHDVIHLATLAHQTRRQEARVQEDEQRLRREALRSLLLRNAALKAEARRRAPSAPGSRMVMNAQRSLRNQMLRHQPENNGMKNKGAGSGLGSSRRRPTSGTLRSGVERRWQGKGTPTRVTPQEGSFSSLGMALQISHSILTPRLDEVTPSSSCTVANHLTPRSAATAPSTPLRPVGSTPTRRLHIQPLPLATILWESQGIDSPDNVPPQHSVRASPRRRESMLRRQSPSLASHHSSPRPAARSLQRSGKEGPSPLRSPQAHVGKQIGGVYDVTRAGDSEPIGPGRAQGVSEKRRYTAAQQQLSVGRLAGTSPRLTATTSVKKGKCITTFSGHWSPRSGPRTPGSTQMSASKASGRCGLRGNLSVENVPSNLESLPPPVGGGKKSKVARGCVHAVPSHRPPAITVTSTIDSAGNES